MSATDGCLRCMTWNIAGAVANENPASATVAETTRRIANCIVALNPDIVSLQEVPFFDGAASGLAEELASATALKHCYSIAVSPSHLHANAQLGIAVLSRYPLTGVERVNLPNPGLTVEVNGKTERSHDRGMLVAKLLFQDREMHYVCMHLPPFAMFKRHPAEPLFAPLKAALKNALLPLADRPLIIAADLNTETVRHVVPDLLQKHGCFELIYAPTKIDGSVCDQIVCSAHWSDGTARIIPSAFDHSICVGDVRLTPAAASAGRPAAAQESRSVTVLHLSDLHFGEGAREDVDWKAWLEAATRSTRADRLKRYIKALPRCPDYVVVSGDISIAGKPAGMKQFREMVTQLIRDHALPPADRIVVVPGNHDVTRKLGDRFAVNEERWQTFKTELGDRHVRPWLPGDPPPAEIERQFKELMVAAKDVWGGIRVELDTRTDEITRTPFPLVFDRTRKILFYAFNSASVSGTRIAIDVQVEHDIAALQAIALQNTAQVARLTAELNRLREVDPARVSPAEIDLFQAMMNLLRNEVPEEFAAATKIAVLHHHVSPIYGEEVTQFETLLNAGKFKKLISAEGFQIVLHGHKHWPEPFLDTAITGGGQLHVISGGTIGGWEERFGPGFFYIEITPGHELASTFIRLDDQNPGSAIAAALKESRNIVSLSAAEAPPRRGETQSVFGVRNLRSLYQMTEKSMMQKLRRQTVMVDGIPYENVGWNHFLGQPEVTPFGTAFGLRVMRLLKPGSAEYRRIRPQVRSTLLRMRRRNGGWSASSLGEPGQPVETAVTLQALSGILQESELTQCGKVLEDIVSAEACGAVLDSSYAVALIAQTLVDVLPESPLVHKLSQLLLQGAVRNEHGSYLCWSARTFATPDRVTPYADGAPSAAHTSHAIIALRSLYENSDGRSGATAEVLRTACDWLLQAAWDDGIDVIEECDGKRLPMNIFTRASAVTALLMCDVDPKTPRIHETVEYLWTAHDEGLWRFGDVKSPVWATLTSLQTLTEFYFRGSPLRE
jgi:endonuclease/exonuclease/phosphatase family metal-dependent hydrolase